MEILKDDPRMLYFTDCKNSMDTTLDVLGKIVD
jgi:hypothetical protein